MVYNEDKKFMFIHLPRTGGTFINNVLRYDIKSKSPYKDNHYDVKTYFDELGLKLPDYKIFTVVRNPWDWYVSLYEYGIQNNASEYRVFRKKSEDTFSNWLNNIIHFNANEEELEDEYENSTSYFYKKHTKKNFPIGWLTFRYFYSIGLPCDVLIFESLNTDLKTYLQGFYGPKTFDLIDTMGKINKSNKKDYKEYYTGKDIDLVKEKENYIISKFNYTF